ncbi:MAG: YdeI/OmpD-associated family protein [Calditrichaceae bacterium]
MAGKNKVKGGSGFSRLKRPKHSMPNFIHDALRERGLMGAYKERPAYQQNDYIGWINRAVRPETKQKRLNQMLDELERGGLYMNMKHAVSEKN